MITDRGDIILSLLRGSKDIFIRNVVDGKAIYIAKNRAAKRYLYSGTMDRLVRENGLIRSHNAIY